MRKGKDPEGPKTCGSGFGSGFGFSNIALRLIRLMLWQEPAGYFTKKDAREESLSADQRKWLDQMQR